MAETLEGYTFQRIESLLREGGVNPVHARPLFNALQRKMLRADLAEVEGILPPVERWLGSGAAPPLCQVEEVGNTPSSDWFTRKYLLRLKGGAEVESVQMGFPGRFTACLSSQVGCAMGCVFCATGQMGFSRNLTAGEMVAQAHHVERRLRESHGEHLRSGGDVGAGPNRNK